MLAKKIFTFLIAMSLCACASKTGDYKKYSFVHQQGTSDYSDYMYYDDSIFDVEANTFSPELASASISLAMSAFASMKENNYQYKSKNAKELLTKLGFKDFDVNEDYKKKPETDSIGLCAAHKKIKDYEVVAISIRGAAYFSEWASNFTIGNELDGYHQGFKLAADNYISWAKTYFNKYDIKGNVKIWTAGYSRAGATTNIASGLIDEMLNNNEKPFGENVNLTRNHFYAYTFEAPMGAPRIINEDDKVTVKTDDYDNIFNIVNINDPVPLVAMHELGFTRYGRDLYLPDPITTLDYQNHFKNVNKLYDAMSNHEVIGSYRIFDFEYKSFSNLKIQDSDKTHSMSQGIFLRELIEYLSKYGLTSVGTRPLEECKQYYKDYIQDGFRNLFAALYQSDSPKDSFIDIAVSLVNDISLINELDVLISDITTEGVDAFVNDIKPILTRGLNK